MRLCLCTETTLYQRAGGGYHGGTRGSTDLVPMERWSVGCDDLDGELGNGFLAERSSRVSLQPDTLSKEEKAPVIKVQLRWEFSLYGCIRRVTSAAKQ